MPTVSRLSGTLTTPEGFAVETEAGGDVYRYELRVSEERDADEDTDGTLELTERTKNGEEVDLAVTEAVREEMAEYGYEVDA